MELCEGRLPNPNFKVFFLLFFRIKQARRLIFSIQLAFNLTRRNIERKIGNVLWRSSMSEPLCELIVQPRLFYISFNFW